MQKGISFVINKKNLSLLPQAYQAIMQQVHLNTQHKLVGFHQKNRHNICLLLRQSGINYIVVDECGLLHNHLKQRQISQIFITH